MAKSPDKAVAEFRERIDTLKAERAEVQAQPAAASDIEQAIDAFIQRNADQYRNRIEVVRLKQRGTLQSLGELDEAFQCFVHGDAIKAALMAEAGNGLAANDRAAELKRIDAELLATERKEESTIVAAEGRGHFITRRADADPRAILDNTGA